MAIQKSFRRAWARWGLAVCVGLVLGCSGGQSVPTSPGGSGADGGPRPAVRGETGYQVQQGDLTPAMRLCFRAGS